MLTFQFTRTSKLTYPQRPRGRTVKPRQRLLQQHLETNEILKIVREPNRDRQKTLDNRRFSAIRPVMRLSVKHPLNMSRCSITSFLDGWQSITTTIPPIIGTLVSNISYTFRVPFKVHSVMHHKRIVLTCYISRWEFKTTNTRFLSHRFDQDDAQRRREWQRDPWLAVCTPSEHTPISPREETLGTCPSRS